MQLEISSLQFFTQEVERICRVEQYLHGYFLCLLEVGIEDYTTPMCEATPCVAMEAMGGKSSELLVAAFISMQPVPTVISLSREVGEGTISELAQQFFLNQCFNNKVHVQYPSSRTYMKSVVKHIILSAEQDGQEVLKDLYALYLVLLNSDKGLLLAERCYKTFTFMIPENVRSNLTCTLGNKEASDLIGRRLVTFRVSLDMLDGSTGYCIWPAGLFLAEVLLTHPHLVHGKSVLELGSGTGICGIWLSRLAPSKAVLTDGELSTLLNLRHNLGINGIQVQAENVETPSQQGSKAALEVDCRQLLWETVSEEVIQATSAQVIIGADLIYDPTLVRHLVRVLGMGLQRKTTSKQGLSDTKDSNKVNTLKFEENEYLAPVAYLSTALRNVTTLQFFLDLAAQASLVVTDVTESLKPQRMLPEMHLFDRAQIRLYKVVFS